MSDKEVLDELYKLVENAKNALKEAERFADEHGLSFYFCPEYGMGGTYYGEGSPDLEDNWGPSEAGWYSSSASC